MHRGISRLGRLANLIALGGGVALIGQGVQTGNVAGTVKDATSGKALAGATVVLKTPQGDRTAITDANGAFRFSQLVPNNVRVVVSANNYISASTDLRVNIDKTNIVDMALKPQGQAAATVTVVATSDNIDVTEAKTGENFSLNSVNALPINNRSITAIASLAPGTSSDSNGITIRGSQATQVQYLVDGADVMDPVTGGPAVRLNEEMLEEVQVVSGGASAEYGRFTGGVVNTVTKSGTNDFSGTARLDVTNLSWNAYNPLNRGANGTATFPNANQIVQQYVVSGPIIKDHLFFVAGYRTTSPQTSTPGTTTGVDNTGAPMGVAFASTRSEERKDIKLDWQINTNHRVFWQYNKTETKRANIDYPSAFGFGSTGIDSLSSQNDTFSYVTFGYSGQLTSSMLLDVRLNQKKETLGGPGSGGQGGKNVAWVDVNTFSIYDNGFFGSDGDSRPIRTANASLTWFLQAMGTHEIKFGAQLFESKHNAANSQTPTNMFIYFNGFNDTTTPGNTAVGNRVLTADDPNLTYLDVWIPTAGATTKNRIDGYFVNDKWKLNDHWAFNIGLRYDSFKSQNDLGVNNFDFHDISPRLSGTYDIFGNGQWVVTGSYDVYVGQVIQGATDGSSTVGNPAEYDYTWHPTQPGNDPYDLRNWSSTPFNVYDPAQYRQDNLIDPGLKSPRMIEKMIELRHNDGQGTSWSIAYSRRKWDRFVDDFVTGIDAANGSKIIEIKNDDDARRDYQGFEVVYDRRVNEAFSYGFNATLSELRGNYEGGQVGTTEQKNNFGPTAIPNSHVAPYGFLAADLPFSFVGHANWTKQLGFGRLNVGALEFYTAGSPYSTTVTSPTMAPAGYATSFTNYLDGRGNMRFANTYRTDMQVAYDFPIFKKLMGFARLNITNFFNHQMLSTWNTSGGTYSVAQATANNANYANDYNLTFKPSSRSYGKPTSASNYIGARALNLAFGIRF